MTNEQLFQALAGVKTEYLDHSEGAVPARKRLMPRIILVAAVVASIIGTALAVPYIRNYLKNLYECMIGSKADIVICGVQKFWERSKERKISG